MSSPAAQFGNGLGQPDFKLQPKIMHPSVQFTTPTGPVLQMPPRPTAPTPQSPAAGNGLFSPRTGGSGPFPNLLQVGNDASKANLTESSDGPMNPVHKLSTLQGQITDILDHVRFLQSENDVLRNRATTRGRVMMAQWFGQSDKVLKQACFHEWKAIFAKSKQAAHHANITEEVRKQERDRHTQLLDDHIKDSEGRMKQEAKKLKGEERQKFESNLAELEKAFQDREEDSRKQFHNELEELRAKYEAKLSEEAEKLDTLQHQHEAVCDDLEKLKVQFEKSEKVVKVVQASVADYKQDPAVAHMTFQQPQLPEEAAVSYVKNALHEILYSVDPRYLGRSNIPTIREIAIEERQAYAQANNQEPIRDQAGVINHASLRTPRILNPIIPLEQQP